MLRSAMLTLSYSDRNHCRVSNITRRPNHFTGQRYSGHRSCLSASVFARASRWALYTFIRIDDDGTVQKFGLTKWNTVPLRLQNTQILTFTPRWPKVVLLGQVLPEFGVRIYQSSDSSNMYDLRLCLY